MSRLRRRAPVVYPVALLALTAIQWVSPQRDGPLAVTQVVAPWLFLPLLVLAPHAALLRDRALVLALAGCALVFGVQVGPEYVPSGRSAPDGAAVPLTVMSWNTLVTNSREAVLAGVLASDADVVGLVEVSRRQARALLTDPVVTARWPYRVVLPGESRTLLSKRPIRASGLAVNPALREGAAVLWARLDGITVFVAHPLPATAAPARALPVAYDATPRDQEIVWTRGLVDRAAATGQRVLLLGDFNVTDREPGARLLVHGLHDAHAEVGWGAGNSWAPVTARRRGIALLRIDRALGGPGVLPVSIRTDCGWRGSDHCVLTTTFAVEP